MNTSAPSSPASISSAAADNSNIVSLPQLFQPADIVFAYQQRDDAHDAEGTVNQPPEKRNPPVPFS